MPVQIPHSGAQKKVAEECHSEEHSCSAKWAAISLASEKQRAADSGASALHDWLCQRQHTEAWRWPGGPYIWPISSQPLQWLSTPLRACWNNIIRTCKCWRPPCPLPAQNSESRKHSECDLSALRPGPFLNGISCKTARTLHCWMWSGVSLMQGYNMDLIK